jgi:DNA-binding CsgD family transcriptional regulator
MTTSVAGAGGPCHPRKVGFSCPGVAWRERVGDHERVRAGTRRGLAARLHDATQPGGDLPGLATAVYAAVAREIPFAFACFATCDPATGLLTWSSKTRPLGCGDEEFVAVEFSGPDINSLAEIARRDPPAGALWLDTGGRLDTCRRYREFLRPRFGFTDELRVVFRSRTASWGALALYREGDDGPFTAADIRELGAVSELLACAIQRTLFCRTLASNAAPAPGPAVLIIDAADQVTHLSPAARAAIGELGGWEHGSLPTSLLAVAAVARAGTASSESRARGRSGGWLSLRAALLDGPPGRADVVVSIEPTPRTDLSRLALAARGLTAREEDVAALVLQGASTRSIAAALYLSPHTVQDHLKAIFAKLGVSSRREMIAQLILG